MTSALTVPLLRQDLRIDGCEHRNGRRYLRLQDWVLRGPAHPGFVLSLDALPYLLPESRLYCADGVLPRDTRPAGPAWERFIADLDEKGLLETPKVAAARAERLRDWEAQPLRPPVCAGRSYPAERGALTAALERCFLEGPGRLPGREPGSEVCLGVFAPHADLETSGACAAHAYLALADAAPVETYLLIGPCHAYYGQPSEVLTRDMTTPLGTVPVDRELAERLAAASRGAITTGGAANAVDHSLEMHLPFLQYVHQRQGRPLRVVPLLINVPYYIYLYREEPGAPLNYALAPVRGVEQYLERLVEAVRSVLRPGPVALVVSGDLTHYGAHYNYVLEDGRDFRAQCRARDRAALRAVEAGRPDEALAAAIETTHCGTYALYVAQRALDGAPGRLLDYTCTGSLADAGDPAELGLSVASMVFMAGSERRDMGS